MLPSTFQELVWVKVRTMKWRRTQRSSCFRGVTPICLFHLPFHPICGAFSSSYKSLSSYHPPIPCPAIVWDRNCPTFWCQPQKMALDSHTAQHGAWQGLYRVMWNPWTSAHFPRIFTLPFTTHRICPHVTQKVFFSINQCQMHVFVTYLWHVYFSSVPLQSCNSSLCVS